MNATRREHAETCYNAWVPKRSQYQAAEEYMFVQPQRTSDLDSSPHAFCPSKAAPCNEGYCVLFRVSHPPPVSNNPKLPLWGGSGEGNACKHHNTDAAALGIPLHIDLIALGIVSRQRGKPARHDFK